MNTGIIGFTSFTSRFRFFTPLMFTVECCSSIIGIRVRIRVRIRITIKSKIHTTIAQKIYLNN